MSGDESGQCGPQRRPRGIQHTRFGAAHIGDDRVRWKGIFNRLGHFQEPINRKAKNSEIRMGGHTRGIRSAEVDESARPHFLNSPGPARPCTEFGLRAALA